MAAVLHRTTKQYLSSVNTPDYPIIDWIINPDLSQVIGYDRKYWSISGDTVNLMDQAARNAVDAAEAAAIVSADKAEQKARIDDEKAIKALALVLLDIYDLFKTELKGAALNNPLPTISAAQMRQRFLDKVDSL